VSDERHATGKREGTRVGNFLGGLVSSLSVILETIQVLVSLIAFLAAISLLLNDRVGEVCMQRQCRTSRSRGDRSRHTRCWWRLRSRRRFTRIGVEIVFIANTVHAMVFQTIHVLVSFVAANVLALVWLVDDDGVFG